jgi:hypothetical protein
MIDIGQVERGTNSQASLVLFEQWLTLICGGIAAEVF